MELVSLVLLTQEALERAAMVPCALKILLLALRPAGSKGKLQLKAVCAGLLLKPNSGAFVDAAFDAVRTLYRMIRAAMLQPDCAVNIYELTYHAGAAMDILQYLCSVPLFYYRWDIVHNAFVYVRMCVLRQWTCGSAALVRVSS
jgi:hypothetical protein